MVSTINSSEAMGIAHRIRERDWSTHPLGRIDTWPSALHGALAACLTARSPMQIWWGTSAIIFYNDAFAPWLGEQSTDALGQRAADVYGDRWGTLCPAVQRVFVTAEIVEVAGFLLSPIRVVDNVEGIVCTFADGVADGLSTAPSVTPPIAMSAHALRVLIVEDDDMTAQTTQLLLQQLGYLVAIAHDGAVAMEVARIFSPDVILMDLHLPVLDGWEVARRLRQKLGEVPVIAMTGLDTSSARDRSVAAGFVEYLCKPINAAQLDRCLSTYKSAQSN